MKTKFMVAGLAVGLLGACSSSSDGASTTQLTAAGKAFSAATASVERLGNLSPSPVTSFASNIVSPSSTGLAAIWNNTGIGFQDERPDPQVPVSLKEYMGLQFDVDAVRENGSAINGFGRFAHSNRVMCIFANALSATTSASLVAAGTATISFNSSLKATMVSQCGFSAADTADLPATAVLTFSTPSPATIFDLKIVADLGGETETMYAKWGSADGNVAFAGGEDNGNGRTRTIVIYNANTGVLKAEYLSKTKIDGYGMTIHRLWQDGASSEARVFTVWDQNYSTTTTTTPGNKLRYIVDGNVDDSATHLSFAIEFTNYGASNSGTYEGCVRKSNGSVGDVSTVTSNQFTCANTSGNGGRATAFAAASISDFLTKSTQVSPTWHSLTNAPGLGWTSADTMLTTGIE